MPSSLGFASVMFLAASRYNGLNQRIMWQYDADAASGLEDDEKFYFVYDAKWRIVASVKDKGLASPDQAVNVQEAFVYHAAGFAGSGSSSYIDSVIMRDTDTNFAWADGSDDVLNVRTFYVQNWRNDVMAILDSDGNPLERVRYTAYGTPSSHPIADVNGDGTVNSSDQSQWAALLAGGTNSAVFAQPDLNADGLFPDQTDEDFFAAQYTRVGAGSVFGMNKLSSVNSRKGYAGYEWDYVNSAWSSRRYLFDSQSGRSLAQGLWPHLPPFRRDKPQQPPNAPPATLIPPNSIEPYACAEGFVYDARTDSCVRREWRYKDINECYASYGECLTDGTSRSTCLQRFHFCLGDFPFGPGSENPERIRPLNIPHVITPAWSGVGHCFFCMPDGTTIGYGPNGWEDNNANDLLFCHRYKASWNQECVRVAILTMCQLTTSACPRYEPNKQYSYPWNDCNDACSCMRNAFMTCRPIVVAQ